MFFGNIALSILDVEWTDRGRSKSKLHPKTKAFADFLLNLHPGILSKRMRAERNELQRLPSYDKSLAPRLAKRVSRPLRMAGDTDDVVDEWSSEWRKSQEDTATYLGRAGDIFVKGLPTVWVIAENSVEGVHQGVHTLRGKTRDHPWSVLAFERKGDAEQYSHLASSPDIVMTPVEWKSDQLVDFCRGQGFEVAFAPMGQLVIPTASSEQYDNDVTTDDSASNVTTELRKKDVLAIMKLKVRDAMNTRPRGLTHSSEMEMLGQPCMVLQGVAECWVVMFNLMQPNEGVYTLQNKEGKQYLLAFESEGDARLFAKKLQGGSLGAGFETATPSQWETQKLTKFCEDGGFDVSLIADGTNMIPPEVNMFDVEAFERIGAKSPQLSLGLEYQRALFEYLLSKGSDSDS